MLTLFLGILIGMLLVVIVIMIYDFGLTPGAKVTFHFATPAIDELLIPLSFILMGAILVLRWRVDSLHKRLAGLRSDLESAKIPQFASMWTQASSGFFMLFLGCFLLIGKLADFLGDVPFFIIPICFFVWLILTCGVDLYLTIRSKSYMRRE